MGALESATKSVFERWWSRNHGESGMSTRVPGFRGDPAADEDAESHLPPAARRALEEAEARRTRVKAVPSLEVNGRGGLDPVRYGDWEVKGLASDF
jgi:hypothetical protein